MKLDTHKMIRRSLLLWDACLGKGVEEAITRSNLQDIHTFRVPQGVLLILAIFINNIQVIFFLLYFVIIIYVMHVHVYFNSKM